MKRNCIEFESFDVDMPDVDPDRIRKWIVDVAAGYGFEVGRLLYVFMNDDEILKVNRDSLGHDYYTDIITFDYTRGHVISGEMDISIDTVLSNALNVGESYIRELHRVIIHGVLHLVGINDKGPGEREIMEKAENRALALLSLS